MLNQPTTVPGREGYKKVFYESKKNFKLKQRLGIVWALLAVPT